MGGCPSLRPSSSVQKEEGLREEHGSFPRRKLRRGPVLFDRLGRRKNRLPAALRRSRGGQIARSPVIRPPRGLAPLCKGSWQGRQALTEGLWVSYRNGLTVAGRLLLHLAYNPSASHSLSTSPYTGEARGGWKKLAPRLSPPVLHPKRGGFTGGTWFRPVRSRAARGAVPQWRFRRNARDRKGELAGPTGPD